MHLGQVAAAGMATLMLITGCSSNDEPEATPEEQETVGQETPSDTPTATPTPTLSEREIQDILTEAWLTDDEAAQIDTFINTDYDRELGLSATTFNYCGDDAAHEGDALRVARAQRWWRNEARSDGAEGQLTIGHEIVLYEGEGLEQYLAGVAGLPEDCPEAEINNVGTVVWSPAPVLEGLPDGTVAVHNDTHPTSGPSTSGFIIAIPVGHLLGALYLEGDDEERMIDLVAELSQRLADKLEEARQQIEAGDAG